MDDSSHIEKTNEHRFNVWFHFTSFIGVKQIWSLPLAWLLLSFKMISIALWFVTCDDLGKKFRLFENFPWKQSILSRNLVFAVQSTVRIHFAIHFVAYFLILKSFNFKFAILNSNSLQISLQLHWWSIVNLPGWFWWFFWHSHLFRLLLMSRESLIFNWHFPTF